MEQQNDFEIMEFHNYTDPVLSSSRGTSEAVIEYQARRMRNGGTCVYSVDGDGDRLCR